MTTYYVDNSSSAASDLNAGTSAAAPLLTVGAVNNLHLNPGDIVAFKAGTSYTASTPWDGALQISALGTASAPITFQAYGTGAAPTFANTSSVWSASIALTGASYVVINGLAAVQGMKAGIMMDPTTNNVTIENNDIGHVGQGVIVDGVNNRILNNSIHDLVMVYNPPLSVDPTGGYGAEAVLVLGIGHVLSGNKIWNAQAQSNDFGTDGGGFEFWGSVSNIHIFNNDVRTSAGFVEAGGLPGSLSNIQIDHNVSYNNGDFASFHNGASFPTTLSHVVIHDNTIVDTNNTPNTLSTFYFDSPVTKAQAQIYNNIISLNNGDSVFEQHGDYHFNNLINLQSTATHLYNNWDMTLNPGESYGAATFVSLAAGDLHINAGGGGSSLGAYNGLNLAQSSSIVATQILNQNINYGRPFTLSVGSYFTDTSPGGTLSYTATLWNGSALPSWLHFANGTFSGTPDSSSAGSTSQIIVTATDSSSSASVADVFSMNIAAAPPQIVHQISNQTAAPGAAFNFAVTTDFSDPNPGGALSYSVVQTSGSALPNWLHFTNGTFTGTPGTADAGTDLQLQVTATDTSGTHVSQAFSIKVSGGPTQPQGGPIVTVSDLMPIAGTTLSAAQMFSATDSVRPIQEYQFVSWWNTSTSGQFTLNGVSQAAGTIVDVTPSNLSSVAFYAGSSYDLLSIRAFDGVNWSNWASVKVAPQAAQLPFVSSQIPTQTATAGTAFSLPMSADFTDPNPIGSLTYAATLSNGSALPAWLRFSNSTFSGTPAGTDIGSLQVTVTATDAATGSVSDTFGLTVAAAPQAPVVASQIANQQDTVGTAFSLNVAGNFSDPNGDALTYTATLANGAALPSWLHFTNGSFSGTPVPGDIAALQVKVTATDPTQLSVSDTFGLTVAAAPQAPVVATQIANQQDTAGTAFSLNVASNFSDPNGDALTYTATLANGAALPSWLHFSNGSFSGTPAAGDIAALQVKVTATDPTQLSVSDTFGLTVAAAPQAPVVATQIANQQDTAGTAFSLNVAGNFSDPNGDALTYTATLANGAALPSWLHFTNGSFSGTPVPGDIAALQVKVTATDPTQLSVSDTFGLTVAAAPQAPVVATQIANQQDTAGTAFSLNVASNFSDPNGDALTYNATLANGAALPSWLHFTNGSFSGTPAPGDIAALQVKVTATDPTQLSVSDTFGLTVAAAPQAPVVATQIANQQDTAGTAFSLNVAGNFSDPNGDALTYTATLASGAALPSWLHFSNGAFSGTPAAGDIAALQVKVTATDPTQLSVSDTFGLTVAATPQAPVVAAQIANQQDTAGTAFSLNVAGNFSDPNGDALTYTATLASGAALPSWLHFSNGAFSGTPAAGDIAALQVKVTATDPTQLSVSDTFGLTVAATPQAPVVAAQIANQQDTAGTAFSLNVAGNFSDPNGDALTYTATLANGAALPSWLHFSNGSFSGTPAAGDIAALQVKVTATDPTQLSVSDTFGLTVAAAPQAPVVATQIANQQDTAGTAFSLNVAGNFSDPNGDALTYTATLASGAALPSWLHFSNGSFSGTPAAGDIAALQVKVTATDPTQLSVSDTFGLTVAAAPQAPVVASQIANQQDTVGTAFSLNVAGNFSDPNGDALTYTATLASGAALPSWLHFSNGAFSGTPAAGDIAALQVKVTATDPTQLSVSDTFGLTVAATLPTLLTTLAVKPAAGTTLQFSDLVSLQGSPNEIKFVDWWNTPGSGHFELNGLAQAKGTTITIAANQVSSLHYVVGSAGAAGQDVLQFQASNDGGNTWGTNGLDWAWATVSIMPVTAGQQAPVVASQIANQHDTVSTAFSLNVAGNFSDPNGDALTYTATLANGAALPSWLHFTNGAFSGTPGAGDIAALQVKVTATDRTQLSVFDAFGLTVAAAPQPPVVATQIANQQDTVGTAFSLNVAGNFSDPNGDALTYTATLANGAALPSWLHFTNGAFSGTPAAGDIAALQVKVTATDPTQLSVSDTFGLTVAAAPQAPVVASQIANQQDAVGTAFSLNVASNFSDPNGDALTYTATLASGAALPSWLHFSNGAFSGTPGAGDIAALQVKVTATDPTQLSVSDTFGLTVAATLPTLLTAVAVKPAANTTLQFSDLVSLHGNPNEIKFVDWWNTPGSGHFELNGAAQAKGTSITISTNQVSSLHYIVGSSGAAGQDVLQFQASNDGGNTWGTNGLDWGWTTVSIAPI